jgi:hypothetical protein
MVFSYEARLLLRKGLKPKLIKTCEYCGEQLETPYPNKIYHTVCARLLNVERSYRYKNVDKI